MEEEEEVCLPDGALEYGDYFSIVKTDYYNKAGAEAACREMGNNAICHITKINAFHLDLFSLN